MTLFYIFKFILLYKLKLKRIDEDVISIRLIKVNHLYFNLPLWFPNKSLNYKETKFYQI